MSLSFISQVQNCHIHPNEPLTFLCGADICSQRALCNICKDAHHSQRKLIPFQDIQEKKIFTKLEKASQEEGPENPEMILQQAEAMFLNLKKELDEAFDQLKKSTFDMIYSKLSRTKSWNVIQNELQTQYENTFNDHFSPRSIHLETFAKGYSSILLQLEKKEKEPQILVRTPKHEFVRLVTDIKDVMMNHQKRLLTIEKLQPLFQRTKMDLKKLKKETTVKTGYQKGIKPTAITQIDDLSLLATSGEKDISLWCANMFEKIYTKDDVHTDPIISLVYSPKQRTLLSCANDRTLKFHSITNQRRLNLVKILTLPFTSSLFGILPIEEKGVILGAGNGPDIRIWGLQDYKLKGMIKTANNGDMGPHLTYCRKENIVAAFFYRIGKIGLFSFKSKELLKELDTKMKASEIISEAMCYVEKKSLLIASYEFDKVRVWNLQNMKFNVVKDIDVKGYYFDMIGLEEDDYVIAVNYMKELQVLSLNKYQLVHKMTFGLKNVGSLIHMKRLNKFIVADALSDKMCILGYN